MKILYIITGLRLGGAEMQLLLIAKNMKQRGHKVMVISMESGGVMQEEFRIAGISVSGLDISGASTLFGGYRRFKKAVIDFFPDVIHSHMIHANYFARIFKLFNPRYKLICTAHNIIEGNDALMKGYYLTKTIPDWSTNVSKQAYDYFISERLFSSKSSYIPNAIDTELFAPRNVDSRLNNELAIPAGAYVYFSAGRLQDQKNYEMLLNAFKLVKKDTGNSILVIAGEGPLQQKLVEQAKSLEIFDQTRWLGRRKDVPALMNLCDCFVLSSKYEGFGLVIAEAMATRKPVVATDCGGVGEVMGRFGQLVPVNDTVGLAKAMLRQQTESVNQGELEGAREYIKQSYSISSVMDQWVNLYSNLTNASLR
jgi:glycosyltransferase involved in cell wall biosynthesis